MNKFETFKKNYEEAIETINTFLEGPESMTELTKWLMTTDANPYSYLDHTWAGMTQSAEGMAGLLNYIHHAVVDDSDITFVKVDNEPRIVFAHPADDYFRDVVLSSQEKELEKSFEEKYGMGKKEIHVLNIKPNDFGKVYDEYQKEQVKKWFLSDAKRHSVEFAKQHYEHYNCWDESWMNEV
jgi:hypothetical protein